MSRLCRIVAVLLLLVGTVRAAEMQSASDTPGTVPVTVRVDNHRGYGRVTFGFAAPMLYDLSSEPGQVKLEVHGVPALPAPERLPRNVRAIRPLGTAIELDLVEGAQARATQVGGRIIVDLLDPPRPQPAHPTRQRTRRTLPLPATAARLPPAVPASPSKAGTSVRGPTCFPAVVSCRLTPAACTCTRAAIRAAARTAFAPGAA